MTYGAGPVIGILGGMGPAATAEFFRRIVAATPASRDQEHLHILIDNDPSVPDRSAALLGTGADPTPTLVTMAQRLAAAGADLLVIPCNTASAFTQRIADRVDIPILRWDAAVVEGVRQRRPEAHRIGVLATTGTIDAGVYNARLLAEGIDCATPSISGQERVMAIISARKAGTPAADLAAGLDIAVQELLDSDAQDVLLACTELSDIASVMHLDCLDAMDIVVERLLELAKSWAVQG